MAVTVTQNIGHVLTWELVCLPGNTTTVHFRAWKNMSIRVVRAYEETVPTSDGAFELDVKENGTTILTGKLNLLGLSNATWGAASISDGKIAAGADVLVSVASTGTTLTGLTGLVVQIEIEE